MSGVLEVLLGVLGGALLVLLPVASFTGGGMGVLGWMIGSLFVVLFWLFVIALLVVLIVWGVNQARRH